MSGDVQPRKRKDKKRRKDEGEHIPTQTQTPLSSTSSGDDVNIHVHKEGGTGGGICAKLVFFVLLSAIAVVIGMIITEYRGQTDVDTVATESRFSQIFEGWIDSSPDHHDDHIIEETLDELDLDHDEVDGDEHDASEEEEEGVEEEDHDEDEEDEEHEPSEELEEEDEEDVEVSEEKNEDDEDQDEDDEEAVEEDEEENQLDEDDEEEDVQASEEERETYESEEKDDDDDEDDQDHDEDEQELENIGSDEDQDEDDEDESAERESIKDVDEDEDDTDDKKAPEASKQVESDTQPEEPQQESAGMAVKLGVGVALLVVAHLVLVRKWRTAPDEKPKVAKEDSDEPVPDLSRRNTIVVPPTFQEVEPDIEVEEEDYSEEEEDLSEEEEAYEHKSAKTRYQELRSTYTRSLTPEGEIDFHKSPETYDDEYEENVDDEEDEEISEEEEEEDEDKREVESEDEDEYDEDEDEELLKRLEAKYGKLRGEKGAAERQADVENSDSEKSDDGAGYEFSNITNKEDYKIKSEIDEAQKSVQNNSAYAIKLFDKILQKHPSSPRSIYGKALALDYLADQRRSNDMLKKALNFYMQLFNTQDVPDALFEIAAERCIERMRFAGQYVNLINVHKLIMQRFPNNPKHPNDLAVTYLTINRVEDARSVLRQILTKWPNDGFALVHFGFILKTTDNKLIEAVDYLQRGLETKAEGVIDGRFYFHLGDALARLGQNDEAMKVYEDGVKNNVFLSKYQRSLYNVPRLTGKPWWNLQELPYLDLFRLLKENWKKIRDEGLAVLNERGFFRDESENLKDTGDWKQFELFARGQKNPNCRKCPFTCSLIERVPEARNCKRGQTKFSVMHPGTHVWPHCGPTNCRLRAHLGLKVPPKTFIRVADEIRSWEEGEVFVFDDSFEHEVWHNGTELRLVLIVDVWHPELTSAEKRSLSPI